RLESVVDGDGPGPDLTATVEEGAGVEQRHRIRSPGHGDDQPGNGGVRRSARGVPAVHGVRPARGTGRGFGCGGEAVPYGPADGCAGGVEGRAPPRRG